MFLPRSISKSKPKPKLNGLRTNINNHKTSLNIVSSSLPSSPAPLSLEWNESIAISLLEKLSRLKHSQPFHISRLVSSDDDFLSVFQIRNVLIDLYQQAKIHWFTLSKNGYFVSVNTDLIHCNNIESVYIQSIQEYDLISLSLKMNGTFIRFLSQPGWIDIISSSTTSTFNTDEGIWKQTEWENLKIEYLQYQQFLQS